MEDNNDTGSGQFFWIVPIFTSVRTFNSKVMHCNVGALKLMDPLIYFNDLKMHFQNAFSLKLIIHSKSFTYKLGPSDRHLHKTGPTIIIDE